MTEARLCQIEIRTPDPDVSLAFARSVLGWEAAPIALLDYTVIMVPEDCPYGIAFIRSAGAGGSQNTLYFQVDDVKAALAAATAAGGRIRFGPKAVPGLGEVYHVEDPVGLVYGLFVRDRR